MNSVDPESAHAAVRSWPAERRQAAMLGLLRNPPLFDLEVSGACNVDCSFCPRTRMSRPGLAMSDETFEAVLRFLPERAVVMCAGLGDALTNPRLETYVARLRVRGVSSCIITNGVLLGPQRQRSLIDAGIDQIQVSLHGLSDAAYDAIVTRGGDLQRVIGNLEHLASIRPASLRVRIDFVRTPENGAELEPVRALADRLGFALDVRRLHTRGGQVASSRAAGVDGPADSGCGVFTAVTFITAQGDVLSCVNDVMGEAILGNVRTSNWADLVARKVEVVRSGAWFPACTACDDDSRWAILARASVDPLGPAP